VMRFIADGLLWSDEQMLGFITRMQKIFAERGHCLWALEHHPDGEFLGLCGIGWWEVPEFPEIGWWLDEPWWGQGLATEVAKAVRDYGFSELRLPELKSVAHAEHHKSHAVMQRIGMSLERQVKLGELGKDPKDLPVVIYQLASPGH